MGTEENVTTIEYDDAEALRKVLVGQQIVRITETTGAKLNKRQYPGNDYQSYNRDPYDRVIEYHLSGGSVLRAHAHDGGCACSNGCFSVSTPALDDPEVTLPDGATFQPSPLIGATILGVRVEERQSISSWSKDYADLAQTEKVFVDGEPGVDTHDSSTIDVFVYTAMQTAIDDATDASLTLVHSEGGDNGYYGWGFHFSVELGASDIPAEQREHDKVDAMAYGLQALAEFKVEEAR